MHAGFLESDKTEDTRMKKEWIAPTVTTESAFETLAGTCTFASESQDGCANDGISMQPLLSPV